MASTTQQDKFDTFIDEKYIPLDTKVKVFIVILAFLVPVGLCYFFLLKPQMDKIKLFDQQIVTAKSDLKKAQRAARDLPKFERELEETRLIFEEAAIILPKTREIPNLLRNISDLGKSAGLDFLSFKPGNETAKDFYSEFPIEISIRGPYHNLGFFLDQVSKLERLVTVDNIKLDSPQKEGTEMLLNSDCSLLTYRFTNVKLEPQQEKK